MRSPIPNFAAVEGFLTILISFFSLLILNPLGFRSYSFPGHWKQWSIDISLSILGLQLGRSGTGGGGV